MVNNRPYCVVLIILAAPLIAPAQHMTNIAVDSATTGSLNNRLSPASCALTTAPAWCSGSDMGSWINAAYAKLTTSSTKAGHIEISVGIYPYTTPIVLDGASTPVDLECDPGGFGTAPTTVGGATILKFTPSSGTAISFAPGSGSMIFGCTILGSNPGDSTTGLMLGSAASYSLITSTIEMNNISGFGTGINVNNNIYIDTFINNAVHDNGTNLLFAAGSSGTGENVTFVGGSLTNNPGKNSYNTSCVSLVAPSGGDFHFYGVSFDQCGFTVNTSGDTFVDFVADHFENPVWATASDFVTIGPSCNICVLNFYGGVFVEDGASARTEFIGEGSNTSNNGVSVNINGTWFTPAEPKVYMANVTGSARCCQRAYSVATNLNSGMRPGFAGTWLGTEFDYAGSVILGAANGFLTVGGATPTGTGNQVSFGATTGFGNGSSGKSVTTTTRSSGSGPKSPQTIVKYLEIDIGGTKYWVPLTQ